MPTITARCRASFASLRPFIPWKRLIYFLGIALYGVSITVFCGRSLHDPALRHVVLTGFPVIYLVLVVTVLHRVVRQAQALRDRTMAQNAG